METRRKMKLGTSDKVILARRIYTARPVRAGSLCAACVRSPRLLYGPERAEQSGAELQL